MQLDNRAKPQPSSDFATGCQAAPPGNAFSMIGVSMGPGVTALTRISRGTNSAASVRANDRSAALAAPYVALPAIPLTLAI